MNLADGLRINAWRFPGKTATVFGDQRVTYATMNARANQFAHAMLKRGFRRGDKVSIVLTNCIEFLEVYHGLARIGVVSVPINFRLVAREKAYIINNSDSVAIITESEFVPELEGVEFPQLLPHGYILVGRQEDTPDNFANYESLLLDMPVNEPAVDLNEADVFYLGYTSGTTGFPKGALIQTEGTLDVVKNAMLRTAGRADVDMSQRVFLAIMPICHSNSIWATLITFWVGGVNVIFPSGKFDPEKVLQLIEKERVTTTSMVPTMITRIVELPEAVKAKYNLDSLTSLGSSSAPLLTKTKEAALLFFKNARFSEGYGSTETGALTTLRHRDQLRKVRSIGKANPGIEIKLLDEDGHEVKQGEVGVLWAKAKSAFLGYYKEPEKSAQARRGEWVTAGDMAFMDEEGYYFLVDRKNDMIISGGENVYPAEIEEVISKHPAVAEVAVFGIPHKQWGEEVKAIVILRENQAVSQGELQEYCKEQLAGYKRPRSIDFVADFPRTATGKVLKRVLKEPFWRSQERMI
ncbi:long-chain-fatty-acid--CoA ligase FadD13 [Peptococcaceae bacterium CEB3]|nr:long-chain-fatty-acid--CoA ligase FadD13 [Peptococcaceae bacterium CEB3]